MLKIALEAIKDKDYKNYAMEQTLHNQDKPIPIRQFMELHNQKRLDTIQVQFGKLTNNIKSVWAPTNRLVDASKATYVLLNGSRRDYKNVVMSKYRGVYVDQSTNTLLIYLPSQPLSH